LNLTKIAILIEKIIFNSRWLMFPVYVGLGFGFFLLTLKFFQQVVLVVPNIYIISESDLVLIILSLIDIALVGGLLVMVTFSGYENFIARMDSREKKQLDWMGTMGVNSIKNKIASSIVAISSVHLLRVFVEAEKLSTDKIFIFIILHLTFIFSAFIMSVLDKVKKDF